MEEMIDGARLAGLPKRRKTGGRRKGTPNRRTVERQTAIAAIKASGRDPVSFFADLLKNEDAPLDLRFAAAKELAPYVHPKLASIEARTGGLSHEDRLEELRKLMDEDDWSFWGDNRKSRLESLTISMLAIDRSCGAERQRNARWRSMGRSPMAKGQRHTLEDTALLPDGQNLTAEQLDNASVEMLQSYSWAPTSLGVAFIAALPPHAAATWDGCHLNDAEGTPGYDAARVRRVEKREKDTWLYERHERECLQNVNS